MAGNSFTDGDAPDWQARRKHKRSLSVGGTSPSHYFGRRRVMAVLFMVAVLALCYKLVDLHGVQAEALRQQASAFKNATTFMERRGRVLDRNGLVLAQDAVVFDLYLHPQYLNEQPTEQVAKTLVQTLGQKSHYTVAELQQAIARFDPKDSTTHTLVLAKNVSPQLKEQVQAVRLALPVMDEKHNTLKKDKQGNLILAKQRLAGLDWYRHTQRNYPQGRLASHVLGYFNDAIISERTGKPTSMASGVEYSGKRQLKALDPPPMPEATTPERGGLGSVVAMLAQLKPNATPAPLPNGQRTERITVDAEGRPLTVERHVLETLAMGQPVGDIQLTLDARLQHETERILREGIEKHNAQRGCIIVMDPTTGALLAFAVMPDFDPARYFEAPPAHLTNWALTEVYPPGSTMKMLTVAYGLEAGTIEPFSRVLDTGRMTIGGWQIANYDVARNPNPGWIDLTYVLTHSSNVASAKIAQGIPIPTYQKLLGLSGFGRKTGIDLPPEETGLLPPVWDVATHASLGYGYGLGATPLQMATAIAALANGGVRPVPHVMAPVGKVLPPHLQGERMVSEKTAHDVTHLLHQSIEQNVKHPARLANLAVAGKTGTSRKPVTNGRGYGSDLYTSFIGYFPAESPKALVLVVVDSPRRAEAWGSTVAAPLFAEVSNHVVQSLGLLPHQGLSPVIDTSKDAG
jgi:cell division protein FtsI (penicillin-binding protein 3)